MLDAKPLKVPQGGPPADRWGVVYRGVGELTDAMAAITRTLGDLGVLCEIRRLANGEVAIEGETRRQWHQLLAGPHPQRVRGRVECLGPQFKGGSDGETRGDLRVSLDLSLLPWYRRLVVGLWGFWVIGLSALFWFTEPGELRVGEPLADVLLLATMAVLAVVAWVPFLLRSLGGGRIQGTLWQPILRSLDAAGGYLEPEGSGAGRRFGLWFLSYGLSFLLFGGGALVSMAIESAWETSSGGFWFLIVLVALAGLLFGSALAIGVWRGFGLRVEAILLGIGSSASVLFLLATPLLLVLTADASAAAVRARSDQAAAWSRLVLGGTAVIPVLAVGLGLYMLSISGHAWKPLERTFRMRGRLGLYRTAVQGGALLAAARGFFGLYALILGGIVVVALGLVTLWGGQALGIVELDSPLLRVPSLTGPLLARALGLPPDDPWAAKLARGGWVEWAALVWTLFGLSVGERVRKRSRLQRCLEQHPPGNAPSHRTLVEQADRLMRGSGGPPVSLAVTPERAIEAFAHRFAWPRRRWLIQVSEGALEHLTADELEALLAHELAHLRRGHVLCHDLVLWCGRVAFLGDGFCRGLLNSFGWESMADREAVRILGGRKQALVRCIWKIAANKPRLDFSGAADGLGIEAASSISRPSGCEGEDAAARSFRGRWCFLWCLFLQQYLGGSGLHYWHPAPDERAERIRRVEAMTEAATTA